MPVPRTIIIGADSFIGRHLLAAYRQVHADTLGTTRRPERSKIPGLAYLDLEKPDFESLPLGKGAYQAAIIAAAVSKVDHCQRDPQATWRINVAGTLTLIEQLVRRGITPIFLSSDYVFDGTTPAGNLDDAPRCPNTEYGRQKAAVEHALAHVAGSLVLRLSKVYGLNKGDGTFLDEIATHLESGQGYAAAHDQKFSPTLVGDLAPAIMQVQSRGLTGVVNLCAAEAWTRYDIAIAVALQLGVADIFVRRISLDDLPGSIKRPKTTALIPRRLLIETDVQFTTLGEALPRLSRHGVASRAP